MNKLLLGIAINAFSAIIAHASDMPTKAPAVAVAPQTINWTGAYGGLLLGYMSKDAETGITGNNSFSNKLISSGIVGGASNTRPNGYTIGGVAGYDFQFGKIVAGAAADWSYADVYATGVANGNLVNRTINEKISSFGTVRGRVGYLIGPAGGERVLVYATGGGAWATISSNVSSTGTVCGGGITCASGANSDTRWGWVVGGGAEYRLDRSWSLSLEALYAKLGTYNAVLTGSVYGKPVSYTTSQDVNVGIIRTGLTYRF